MSHKSDRQHAREAVAGYHGAKVAELVAHVAEAIDRFRGGELDAFDVDEVLFQYSRAAKELWKFCNIGDVELTAGQLHEGPPIDWWERGAPTRARPRVNDEQPANLLDQPRQPNVRLTGSLLLSTGVFEGPLPDWGSRA